MDPVADHPNKAPFLGILAILDAPSDKSPAGGRGHRVLIPTGVAEKALPSLIGMAINFGTNGAHRPEKKIGIIEDASISGKELWVRGYLWKRDFPEVIADIAASSGLGMSYEIADARVDDLQAEVWHISRLDFIGASVMPRIKTAYTNTDFVLL